MGGEGRATAQMTYPYQPNTYGDWDFVSVWVADVSSNKNDGYPYLSTCGASEQGEGEIEEGESVEGEGEVQPEGEGEVLPEGEGEVLPEGEGEVLPEGEGEVLTEGEGEVLPEGEYEGEGEF